MPTHSLHASVRSFTQKAQPRSLLLTFDAFGTLFHPRQPVPEQYAAIAHEFGLSRTAVTPQRLKAAFKDVFRAQAKRRPNYGRADVLRGQYGGPRQWWEEVIQGSFARALSAEHIPSSSAHTTPHEDRANLPTGMVEALVDRFAGAEGYTLYDDVAPFFARMRELRSSPTSFDRIVVGVISNSDDRVPAVLKALGLRVRDMRADQDLSSMELPGFEERGGSGAVVGSKDVDAASLGRNGSPPNADLDLVITSYEAGEEKPHRLIFDVARRQARSLARHDTYTHGSAPDGVDETGDWVCVHVGDDYDKDYRAAIDAGWQSYLLPRGETQERPAEKIRALMDLIKELKLGS
ncbi:uncharacterized protein N7459_000466 [Penicillium hispanicum]|uniref:uncharacterized protein n=1 Tax=Penicillium hispanicum TaxID=1080232 RepID=UPI00253F7D46|nr:uncharacterized protein N7459_000466 [Penicillium hispanicum]KAJ5594258.1 hypothetical protein N7459_000466 [Penicillium hispanicum]